MSWSINMVGDAAKHLDRFWTRGHSNMERIAINRLAPRMETYAKTHAPWTDRTGNARRSLNCSYKRINRSTFNITLAHGVHYGHHLELMQTGRFAILKPTLRHFFGQAVDELFEGFKDGW